MLLVKDIKLMSGIVIPAIAVKINSIIISQDITAKDIAIDKSDTKFVCVCNLDVFEYDLDTKEIGKYIELGLGQITFSYDIKTKDNVISYGYKKLKKIPIFSNGTMI